MKEGRTDWKGFLRRYVDECQTMGELLLVVKEVWPYVRVAEIGSLFASEIEESRRGRLGSGLQIKVEETKVWWLAYMEKQERLETLRTDLQRVVAGLKEEDIARAYGDTLGGVGYRG